MTQHTNKLYNSIGVNIEQIKSNRAKKAKLKSYVSKKRSHSEGRVQEVKQKEIENLELLRPIKIKLKNKDGYKGVNFQTMVNVKTYNPNIGLFLNHFKLEKLVDKYLNYLNVLRSSSINTLLQREILKHFTKNVFIDLSHKSLTKKKLSSFFSKKGSKEVVKDLLIYVGVLEKVLAEEKRLYMKSKIEELSKRKKLNQYQFEKRFKDQAGKGWRKVAGVDKKVSENRHMKDKGFFMTKTNLKNLNSFKKGGRRNDNTLQEILNISKKTEGNRELNLVNAKEFGNLAQNSAWKNFKIFEKTYGVLHNVGGKCRREVEITTNILKGFNNF